MALQHAASLKWLFCSPVKECSLIPIGPPLATVAILPNAAKSFPFKKAQFRGGFSRIVSRIEASKYSERRGKGEEILETDDDDVVMSDEERLEWRRKIREVMDMCPDVQQELSLAEKQERMQRLLADYPLVVDEEDPEWPEDADGRGFNLDQFFNKITIKNNKKESNDDDDDQDDKKGKELVWQDDDYIRPIKDITSAEWEEAVLKDISPLIVFVHNRYRRAKENENVRNELEKAVHVIWNCGLPSPRCVAIDAVVELDLVSALKVSVFPEIIFAKAGKILYREKATRGADELSKIMAFFYYGAAKPPCLSSLELKEESLPLTH
ncbi:hypothetical protein QQ045_007709 [Rhodiola kirilowii]